MTVRDELVKVMAMGHEIPTLRALSDFVETSTVFLRDHGPALLEALKDAERYRFLKAHKILSGPNPDEWIDENMELDRQAKDVIKAIDRAREGA